MVGERKREKQLTSDIEHSPAGKALLSMDSELIEVNTYILREIWRQR